MTLHTQPLGTMPHGARLAGTVFHGARRVGRLVWLAPRWLIVAVFRVWQLLVSPTYGQTCRFYPSCSAYGVEAVSRHGVVRGLALTVWRILRCNPWNSGGVDPVPDRDARRAATGYVHDVDTCGASGADDDDSAAAGRRAA